MKLKPYPKYKDSGVQWIGEIPEEWEVYKIGQIGKISTSSVDKKEDPDEINIDLVNYVDVYNSKDKKINSKINFMKVTAKPTQLVSNNLKVGDVLFTPSSETEDDIGHSAVVFENLKKTLHSYHLLRLRFNNNASLKLDYKRYLFNNHYVLNQFSSRCVGTTRAILGLNGFKETTCFIPPENEQEFISSFLDSKTSQLDQTIKKDKQLIGLLKEKRIALINHVVTKGLDKNAKMKKSGIDWIGEIPEDWSTWKIAHCFDIIGSGTTPSASDERYFATEDEKGFDWVNTGDLNDGILESSSKKITPIALKDFSALKIFPKGSLIVAMYGATIGKTAITNMRSTFNQACCVLNKSRQLIIRYAHYWFIAKKKDIIALSYGGGQPNISQDVIKRLRIIVPPKEEQTHIVQYLDKETSKIDQIIKKIEEKITLMEEYKKSLIHHVVTGKVDVREAVA